MKIKSFDFINGYKQSASKKELIKTNVIVLIRFLSEKFLFNTNYLAL